MNVTKRNGTVVPFDINKITAAISKAAATTNEIDNLLIPGITEKVIWGLIGDITIEHIQDRVEMVLLELVLRKTARAYIAYREQHARLRDISKTTIDVAGSIDEYLSRADWRVNANANQGYSLGGLILNSSGKMIANYWLSSVYTTEIGQAHRDGDYHIHDLDVFAGYCFAGDTRVALLDGTQPTLKELADNKPYETFWVYSRDVNNRIVPGLAHSPRLTRSNASLIEVLISGGEKIRCTPDHKFMLRDGSYKEAKDLRRGDSLSPLYLSKSGKGYVRVKDAKLGLCSYVHRLVAQAGVGESVHHLNGIKNDNRPENLQVMLDSEHKAMELTITKGKIKWQQANNARLKEYNSSELKKQQVSELANSRQRDANGRFYNHTVLKMPKPVDSEDVYCLTVDVHHNFALAAGIFVHNCAGWSLRNLLTQGFNGVPGRIEAAPPKHMASAIGQMVNFLGTLQNEWAGAQAFSSFDTYIAPYIRIDNLSYREVKQNIQELIYNLNVPSRWGCVPPDTEILTLEGWKKYDEIKIDDMVYGFDRINNIIIPDVVRNINVYHHVGDMIRLTGEDVNQLLTPEHRCLYIDEARCRYAKVTPAKDLVGLEKIFTPKPYNDQNDIVWHLVEATVESYSGTVWCPTTQSSFWVARRQGFVFITGNSQCPFTNLTFDWVCPEDLREQVPIIGGKEAPFTYGDLQVEMDMINKAFMEVMTTGDPKGRIFTFPIPTYNITTDFPWDSENANLLFEMTAKYGLPYFQNFINSDMQPNMVRSMCPLTSDTQVLVRSKQNGIRLTSISKIYHTHIDSKTEYEVWTPQGWCKSSVVKTMMTDILKITLSNGDVVKMGIDHLQPIRGTHGILSTVTADRLAVGDWLPYNKDTIEGKNIGSYSLGFIVGAYIGDGSCCDNIVTYSLNDSTKQNISLIIANTWNNIGYRTKLVSHNSQLLTLKVNSGAGDYIKKYVGGDSALTKYIKSFAFDTTVAFREGIIAGLAATDGSQKKNRIYTSSIRLVETLKSLFASLGKKCRLGSVDTRDGRLGTAPNYRIDFTSRERYGDFFDEDDKFNYYRITNIQQIPAIPNQYLYCFAVHNDEHLFSLASGLVTHNCRLQLRLEELLKRGNGLFGSAEQTGSLGVVTINCARLGYVYRGDIDGLYTRLDRLLELARDSLETKRKVIQRHMDAGLFPYTKRYLGTLRNHFSTIGVNGINEMVRNFSEDAFDITEPTGHAMAVELLDHVRARMLEFQEATGHMYNLEATPAEGTTYRFAREDRKRWSDILQAGCEEAPYYTNSSQLPVGFTTDAFEALERQEELQGKYTGGTVLHLYMGERIESAEVCKRLVRRALTQFRLPYITISPTFSICPVHGYLSGEHEYCPKCDEILAIKEPD